jgi:hypothetical protein
VKLLLPAIGVCFLLFLSQEPLETFEGTEFRRHAGQEHLDIKVICLVKLP